MARTAARSQSSIGTGVVILDKGVILTNIHVVRGRQAHRRHLRDGMESDAIVTGTRPEDDLAVLQAVTIPDDLMAATLQSTSGLSPGDYVTAVGFPFGIGPSVSSGVVSGPEARVPLARGQAHADQPDPVRRGGESGQFRRRRC